jgi:hypothetical protein
LPKDQRDRRGPAATGLPMQTEAAGWPPSAPRC